jgi:hypothetical protein
MHPKYKGALVDSLFIVASNVPVSHPLVLAGAGSGTRIPFDTLVNPEFKSGIKDKDIRHAVEQLYKFLRNAAADDINFVIKPSPLRSNAYINQPDQRALTAHSSENVVPVAETPTSVIETDPRIIFDGRQACLVEVEGITFRISEKKIGNGHAYMVVYVHSAPFETPLMDLSGSDTFINVGQLHADTFATKLTSEDSVLVQKRIYDFLHPIFVSNGYFAEEKALAERRAEIVKSSATKAPASTPKKFPVVGDDDMEKLWPEATTDAKVATETAINNTTGLWRTGKTPEEGNVFQIVRKTGEQEYALWVLAVGKKSPLHGQVQEGRYITTFDGGKLPEKAEMAKVPSQQAILRFIFDEGRAFIDAIFNCHKFLLAKIEDERKMAKKKAIDAIARKKNAEVAKAAAEGVESTGVVVGIINPDENHITAPQFGIRQRQQKTNPETSTQERVIQMTIDSYLAKGDHIGLAVFVKSLKETLPTVRVCEEVVEPSTQGKSTA